MLQLMQRVALVAILISGLRFEIASINVNSERVVSVLVLAYIAARLLTGSPIRFSPPSWAYLGWLVMVFISAALSGFAKHINGVLISVAPFVFYMLFMQTVREDRSSFRFIGLCLTITSIASILVFALWAATGAFDFMIDRGRIKLLMPEPNILGATLVALLLIYTMGSSTRTRKIIVSALTLVAVALAGSKMPIAAYTCAMAYIAIKTKAFKSTRAIATASLSLLFIASAALAFSYQISTIYADKFERQDSVNNRMHGLDLAWTRFLEKPIFGNGPLDFSFAKSYILAEMGTDNERNMWIWQIWMAVAHDEGLIGLIFFITFIIMTWMFSRGKIRQGLNPHIGTSAAVIAIIITSQATTTHLAAIFGLVFGMANNLLGRPQQPSLAGRIRPTRPTASMEGSALPARERIDA